MRSRPAASIPLDGSNRLRLVLLDVKLGLNYEFTQGSADGTTGET